MQVIFFADDIGGANDVGVSGVHAGEQGGKINQKQNW
jgi:hypothetical protein